MKLVGFPLTIAGVFIVVGSFFVKTSVAGSSSPYLPSEGGILNIGLLQNQMMIFQIGLTATLAGILLLAAGSLSETIERLQATPRPPTPPRAASPQLTSCEWCDQTFEAPVLPCSAFSLERLEGLEIEGDRCKAIVGSKLRHTDA
jgi:hypothetical protein